MTSQPMLLASVLLLANVARADFLERWESAPSGQYVPITSETEVTLIPGGGGNWIVGDTVSAFPEECGPTPQYAEIFQGFQGRAVRLFSQNSSTECADNIWIALITDFPEIGNSISIPIVSGTQIYFYETGSLVNPQPGGSLCPFPPCGDNISLLVEDNNGNMVAYVLQRAPTATPQAIAGIYQEFFLNSSTGFYKRNLFADFSQIPGFVASGASVNSIEFKVDEHGTGTLDNLVLPEPGVGVRLATGAISVVMLSRIRRERRGIPEVTDASTRHSGHADRGCC